MCVMNSEPDYACDLVNICMEENINQMEENINQITKKMMGGGRVHWFIYVHVEKRNKAYIYTLSFTTQTHAQARMSFEEYVGFLLEHSLVHFLHCMNLLLLFEIVVAIFRRVSPTFHLHSTGSTLYVKCVLKFKWWLDLSMPPFLRTGIRFDQHWSESSESPRKTHA